MPRSRRALLKTAGITLGSGSLASLAGCLGGHPTNNDASQDEPSPSDPSSPTATTDFTQWLPDPMTTPLRDGYGILYFDIAGIRSHRERIHENAYSRLEAQMLGLIPSEYVDIDDVEATIRIDYTMDMALGSFDPEAFGEKLTSDSRESTTASSRTPTTPTRTPWPEPEHYREFDLYGTEYVYAVSENALMRVSPAGDGDAVTHAKALIDAPTAETSQYVDSNEYAAAMIGVVDDAHAVWCYPEAMDGSTSRGFRKDIITGGLKSWRFETETTHLTFANTYFDTKAAESGELAEFIKSNSDRFGPYDGLDVTIEGRMAWTDGTIPTAEFDYLSAGGPGDGVMTPN